MEITGLLFTFLYGAGLLWVYFQWWRYRGFAANKMRDDRNIAVDIPVSLIIPVRNEADGIGLLLKDLAGQKTKNGEKFPFEKLEVIVIDDHSEDSTREMVRSFIEKVPYTLRVIANQEGGFRGSAFKKQAVMLGVQNAGGKVILQTDGDCRIPPYWVFNYWYAFSSRDVKMVAGPVIFQESPNLLEKFQMFEQAALTGITAATIKAGFPVMCNAANMGYEQAVFQKVNGYQGNMNIPSGDDEFLLKKVNHLYPGGVKFINDRGAAVQTSAKSRWKDLYQQRKRWAQKWRHGKKWYELVMPFFIFCYHFWLLATTFLMVTGSYPSSLVISQWTIKILGEYCVLSRVFKSLNYRFRWPYFIIFQFLYSFYAVFFGIAANAGAYEWKGRKYP